MCVSVGPYADKYAYAFMIALVYVGVLLYFLLNGFLPPSLILLYFFLYFLSLTLKHR